MLTIQNNLKNTNLETLSKRLIKDDYHNFKLSVVGGGFTEGIANRIISKLTSNEDAKIVVINDVTIQMICKLLETGYKLENITLAFGKWNSNGTVSKDKAVYTIMNSFIKANVKETIKTINLEELFSMKFDLIIANPPYGKVGAQITKKIVDEVNFNEFINLLPIKDMPSVGLEACSHIDMPETVVCPPHSFGDADILTHLLRITKDANKTYSTFEELCADSYFIDKPIVKFMKANVLASHYAVDAIKMWTSNVDVTCSFIYQLLRTQSQHTCGMDQLDSATVANAYNFDNIVVTEKTSVYKNTICTVAGNSNYKALVFNTPEEKINFVEFYKNNRNFINRMIASQFITIRNDAACFPKVDWTKSDWTIEKILKVVANYSDEEVQAVLDTMNKDYAVKDDESIERLFGEYLK
jgi:hypothetical protein